MQDAKAGKSSHCLWEGELKIKTDIMKRRPKLSMLLLSKEKKTYSFMKVLLDMTSNWVQRLGEPSVL